MTATFISILRNAEPYLERYLAQIDELCRAMPLAVRVAEGDSTDDTFKILDESALITEVIQVPHGGPLFGSVDDPVRWGQIAHTYNGLFDHIADSLDGPVLMVEADIIWQPPTMLALLDDLDEFDASAPLVTFGDLFYETWGHRRVDGTPFANSIADAGEGRYPILSAGSCSVMRPEVARKCRYGQTDGVVGFYNEAHREGFSLCLDTNVRVEHPPV